MPGQEAWMTRATTVPAAAADPGTEAGAGYRWRVLTVALFGLFIVPFNIGAVNNAIPNIASDLGLGLSEAVWIQNAFLLTVAVLLLPVGRVADTLGRARF